MMRHASWLFGALVLLPISMSAGEKQPKQEYTEFSRLAHQVVVSQLPKQFEDTTGWGQTIPAPPNLPLPKLRTYIKVGDMVHVPHGSWRRFSGRLEHPDKNLKIVVKDFKQLDERTYRLVVDVDTTLLCHAEFQQWQKGLLLLGVEGAVDANFTAAIVCDIGVSFDFAKFPPALSLSPKVTELALNLVDFKVRNGPILKGEGGERLRNDLKEALRAALKVAEPTIKDHANKAIAQSLKDGKGTISADAIMKAIPQPKK